MIHMESIQNVPKEDVCRKRRRIASTFVATDSVWPSHKIVEVSRLSPSKSGGLIKAASKRCVFGSARSSYLLCETSGKIRQGEVHSDMVISGVTMSIFRDGAYVGEL
jgi:hypothetical protein